MSKNILDLNDDDIIFFFSRISFANMLAMGGTCKRLRHLAQCAYRTYPKPVEYNMENYNDGYKLSALKAVLQTFGPNIKELKFNGLNNGTASRHFFDLIVTHCFPSKLKCLNMVRTELKVVNAVRCRKILEHLENIELHECTANEEGAFEAFITPCKELKSLSLFRLNRFDGSFLSNITGQLESLELVFLMDSEQFIINIGTQIKFLALRCVPCDVRCPSRDLSNLRIFLLSCGRVADRIQDQAFMLLKYTGNQLKILKLAPFEKRAYGTEISTVGNQLKSLSLIDNSDNPCEHILTLLDNNKNIRSLDLDLEYDSLYSEVLKRIPNVEHLSIRLTTHMNWDGILLLKKLKSVTVSFFGVAPRISGNFIRILSQVQTLEVLGASVDAVGKFNEKLLKLKKLKVLKLFFADATPMGAEFYGKIAAHLSDLEELQILVPSFYRQTIQRDWNSLSINSLQFTHIINGRQLSKAKAALKVYQDRFYHEKSVKSLGPKMGEHINVIELLPFKHEEVQHF